MENETCQIATNVRSHSETNPYVVLHEIGAHGDENLSARVTTCVSSLFLFHHTTFVSTHAPLRRHPANVMSPTRTYARTQEWPKDTLGKVKDNETVKDELQEKNRRISELEEKLRTQEILREEEEEVTSSSKGMKDDCKVTIETNESWKKEVELKNQRIVELEGELDVYKRNKEKNNESLQMSIDKDSWLKELEVKNRRIVQLEDEVMGLKKEQDSQNARLKKNIDVKSKENNESWKLEIEAKNRRIVELEQEMESLENFLREHADTESLRDLEIVIERKTRKIEELEDAVTEFEDFLKQNPDVKELHDLRRQVASSDRRVQELERWIEENSTERNSRIDQSRVIELEEMVTHLEEYVREHNVDVLKRKLQDRECRIEQMQSRVNYLEKELLKLEENTPGKESSKKQRSLQDKGTTMNSSCSKSNDPSNYLSNDVNSELREKEQKMKKMEHAISEKENKLQAYEQQIVENKDEMTRLKKEMATLRKELSEYDDIGVLKEEIRVRDERIQQLEDEVDSLERAFSERIDLEQIEELVNVIKEKDDKERQLAKDLEEKRSKIEELSEALRESVVITSDSEKKLRNEEKIKKSAFERISKLEQRIASMQTASALKCITCQPLLSKLQKYESKLQRLTEERTLQLEDLHQMKREALKAAVSEKDAHLALLELSGIKTAAQTKQAEELKADRKRLLEKLKKEDERSIELSVDSNSVNSDGAPQLLTKILETFDDDNEEILNDRLSESSSPRPATTNGDSCGYTKMTAKMSESRNKREQSEIQHQDSR